MRIALTGGIGSGKSYVGRILERHGIRVYDCDAAAKRLMAENADLQQQLRSLVGDEVYTGGVLNRAVLAKYLLASETNKQRVNDVVHPLVASDFMQSGYEWLESAILFESGFHLRIGFDFTVCVLSPLDMRIKRIMQRDGISREKALAWIHTQMPQEEVAGRCDFVIENDGKKDLNKQIIELIKHINNK